MKTMSVAAQWHQLCNHNHCVRFTDVILRSYGQVMLQNNALSGLIFLLGVLMGGCLTGKPIIGVASLVAVISANIMAYVYQLNEKAWQQGIYGFNACLTGIALATFCENSPYLWCTIVLASILSVFITKALSTILQQWYLPCLTMPFILITWVFLLAIPSFSALARVQTDTTAAHISSFTLLHLLPNSILGIAEVFLFNSILVGITFLIALAVNSLRITLYAIIGSILAIGIALLYGGQLELITLGLYSFNAVLTAITLITFSNSPDSKTNFYILLAIILTVFTQSALTTLLKPYSLPVLTMPFVLVSWLWLLINQTLNQR